MAKKTATKTKRRKKAEDVFHVFGSNPETGAPLPNRTVTRKEWEKEKLEARGYVKPAGFDDVA